MSVLLCSCSRPTETSDLQEDTPSTAAAIPESPEFGDYFVVEGDLLLTADEHAAYREQSAAADAGAPSSAELVVITVGNVPQFYPPDRRVLTYAFDTASFANAPPDAVSKTRTNLEAAMREWEAICADCGIRFESVATEEPVEGDVWFIVRYVGPAPYIAAAFFPHYQASRRYLDVGQKFFSTRFDLVGVMRHELGHTLGYRHEHIRGISGCRLENNEWQPLTPYDPHSVMHYFCGGGGTLSLQISETDIDGHTRLYRN